MQRESPSLMLIGGGPARPDLPRDAEGIALLGDPRNDVHGLMARMHLAFLQAPNAPQRSKAIDGRLVPSLVHLPLEVTGELAAEEHQSLAVRDLHRGLATGLPSGEAIARRIGARPLDADEVGVAELGWEGETPLCYYILKEAEVTQAGRRLGAVGGCIVAEVLTAVVDADPDSYADAEPGWAPTLGDGDGFTLGHLLLLGDR